MLSSSYTKKYVIRIKCECFGDTMTIDKYERIRRIFEQHGPVMKTGQLREHKVFSRDIAKLVSGGDIRKIKTGYYIWGISENNMTDLQLVSAVIPKGIICLQSAANYYDLSTINPMSVAIAIPSDGMKPVLPSYPPIKLVVMPAHTFELGLVADTEDGNGLRIYDRERTVCDFFRKRKTVGEDLALEVLKNYMKGKRRLQLLFEYAGKLHIKTVIQPYIEALI